MYSRFKDNGKAQDSAEMRLLSSKNRGVKYLVSVIDVFIKYVYAIHQINYGLLKKESFIITLYKNGSTIIF